MDAIVLMVLGRIFERGLIVVGGILAIWFGFRLFALVAKDRSSTEISGHGFAFKAERIGPGIFFALFGSILLGNSLFNEITITSDEAALAGVPIELPAKKELVISGFGDIREGDLPASLKAVNTLVNIAESQGEGTTELAGVDYKRFVEAVPALHAFQRSYVDAKFGPGSFDSAVAMQRQCANNTPTCDAFLANRDNEARYSDILDILGAKTN